jgi:hypothetical protein
MSTSLEKLHGSTVVGLDGDVGTIARFLLQLNPWVVRYIVIETGSWWAGKEVLISPWSIAPGSVAGERIALSLTREQVRNSPSYDPTEALTREHEDALLGYYGYPAYWGGPLLWGPVPAATPGAPPDPGLRTGLPDSDAAAVELLDPPTADLADSQQVLGTHLHATDGDVGHVDDLLVESDTWQVRYLVIDTNNWWIGRHVLIAPEWIENFEWPDHKLRVAVDRAAIKGAPEYDPARILTRADELALYRHYRRGPYWTG